jgi:RNA polymerase sigma-70 factor (ECF subfamily)
MAMSGSTAATWEDSPMQDGPGTIGVRRDDRTLDALAARAQRGDADAVTRLCRECEAQVRPYLERVLRRVDDDSEDATQQVLVRVLEALPRFRAQGSAFRAWLFSIAHNVAADCRRAAARRPRATDPRSLVAACDSAAERAPVQAGAGALGELIAPLPRRQREVLTLIYANDWTHEQVGAALGSSPVAVRQLHKRARDVLRPIIGGDSRMA